MAKAPPKKLAKAAVTAPAKGKLPDGRTAASKPPAADTPAALLKRMEARNAELAKALKGAEARIAELERQRDSALDRIEWVIDSLHSLREEQG
jgi:hypothetical protein